MLLEVALVGEEEESHWFEEEEELHWWEKKKSRSGGRRKASSKGFDCDSCDRSFKKQLDSNAEQEKEAIEPIQS